MSGNQIDHALESGRWIRLASGIYGPATSVPTWERQVNAALLTNPAAIAAGLTAARLLGYSSMRQGKPEIMLPFTGNGRSTLARVIRSRHFEAIDRRIADGIVCTSPAETALTLSMRWPYSKIERFIDDGLANGLLTVADFHPILDRLRFARQPGLRELRSIVMARASDSYQPPTSELEHLLFGLLDHPQLPPYSRQVPIGYPTLNATVDAYIDEWFLVVEADGRRWHTQKEDFERDRKRDNAAVAAGLAVVRFTWKSLRYEPDLCLKTLLEAGKRRERL